MTQALKVFIRQPFTQSDNEERKVVQDTMDVVESLGRSYPLHFLINPVAQQASSFKLEFERQQGLPFTPRHFRHFRLQLLDQADVFINIRTGLSESTAFEIAYNLFKGNNAPIFFAIWEGAPIKTTLLQELDEFTKVTYVTFKHAVELQDPMGKFLEAILQEKIQSHDSASKSSHAVH